MSCCCREGLGLCLALCLPIACAVGENDTTDAIEFCLSGEFDLGMRLQGMRPEQSERYPTHFCVITEDESDRVHFSATGKSNPDMSGDFAVSYLPPDVVRLVNRDAPPDIDFLGASVLAEALRYRRMDPRRLMQELRENPEWIREKEKDDWAAVRYPESPHAVRIRRDGDRLLELRTFADMPLRGRVVVSWTWEWSDELAPAVSVTLNDAEVFAARASWRTLSETESAALWGSSAGQQPRELPGEYWPARINMKLEEIANDLYVVQGVRTGFNHIVVDTDLGLVVGDAPAGWIELPQVPPTDLVPGLGISGLSQLFIDFLAEHFPGKPIRAVAITHGHDDHSGGARAFAAAGAEVYAPAGIADYLEVALNRPAMPRDALRSQDKPISVQGVSDRLVLRDETIAVELIEIGPGPHVADSLGVWVPGPGYFFQSDLHVPNSDANQPRLDRLITECWFADWAVAHLPPDTIVINSHSNYQTPIDRLFQYLESDACSNVQPD